MSISKISLLWDERKDFVKVVKVLLPYCDLMKVYYTFMDVKEDYYNPENWKNFYDEAHPQFNGKRGLAYSGMYFWARFPLDRTMIIAADYLGKDDDTVSINKLMDLSYVFDYVSECVPDSDQSLSDEDRLLEQMFMMSSTHWMLYYENHIRKLFELMYRGENSAFLFYDMSSIYTQIINDAPELLETCRAITAEEIILPYFDIPFTELISIRERINVPELPSFMSGFYPSESSRLEECIASKVNLGILSRNEAVMSGKDLYVQALTKELGKPVGYAKLLPVYFSGIKKHANHVWKNEKYIPSYITRISGHRRKSPIYYKVSFLFR